tara:strand:+ start:112 stop:483 length:372 start_codon:yes stop_codon:yes gene_type:complete
MSSNVNDTPTKLLGLVSLIVMYCVVYYGCYWLIVNNDLVIFGRFSVGNCALALWLVGLFVFFVLGVLFLLFWSAITGTGIKIKTNVETASFLVCCWPIIPILFVTLSPLVIMLSAFDKLKPTL